MFHCMSLNHTRYDEVLLRVREAFSPSIGGGRCGLKRVELEHQDSTHDKHSGKRREIWRVRLGFERPLAMGIITDSLDNEFYRCSRSNGESNIYPDGSVMTFFEILEEDEG